MMRFFSRSKKQPSKRSRGTTRFLWCLGFIVLAGFVLRLIVARELAMNDPAVSAPGTETDMATYLALSDAIANGTFSGVFYYQPFYYSVFLPVVKFLFRPAVFAISVSQALCGAGIIFFAGLTAAMIRGRFAGLAAAFLAAASTMLVFYVPYALIEIQQAFWFTLLLYLLVRGRKENSGGHWLLWCGAGLVLGFAILSRGSAWCFLPVICYAAWRGRQQYRIFLRNTGLSIAAAILVQLPFVIHNSLETNTLSGPSTAGSAVLALGNNPEAPPGSLPRPYPETCQVWMSGDTPVVERILDWAMREPAAFLEFQLRKFLLFWDSREIPNNISLEQNGSMSHCLSIAFIPTALLLMLTIAACFAGIRGKKLRIVTLLFILLYALATAAFYLLARFRVPLLGVLCVPAGGMIAALRYGGWKKPIQLAGIAAGFAIVFPAYDFYQKTVEPGMMNLVRRDGVQFEKSENELQILDHGPLFFENRDFVTGTQITKRFSPPDKLNQYEQAYLTLTMLDTRKDTSVPAELVITVNGTTFTVKADTPVRQGLPLYDIKAGPVTPPFGGVFQLHVPGDQLVLLMDTTRHYGRTAVNGKDPGQEACIRLTLTR